MRALDGHLWKHAQFGFQSAISFSGAVSLVWDHVLFQKEFIERHIIQYARPG